MTKENNFIMEETISLQELFRTLRKRLSLIALITVIAITLSGIVSFAFLTPIYQASTQILVSQEKAEPSSFNAQDIQTNLQLINTYNVIIKSPAILSKVIEQLELDTTAAALNSKVVVASEQDSQVLSISVQDEDPRVAVEIANTISTVFQKEVVTLMSVDNVNILAAAEMAENPSPIKPDPILNMAIAAVIGLMLGVGIASLLEYLDTTMKTEQNIEDLLQLPMLGHISPISDKELQNTKMEVTQRRKRA